MARLRIRPIEDLLADKYARLHSYQRLYSYLVKHLPVHDSRHLSWHINIPQHIYQGGNEGRRLSSILPQSDQLYCWHCDTTLTIPMKYARFHEATYKAYRSVYYTPSAPQECQCHNLKTLTDHNGNLRVYVEDSLESSFALRHGPIDLLEGAQRGDTTNIAKVFDGAKPKTTDPFTYEVRSNITINHINLYKVKEHTQHALLPTANLKEYSRVYNIVILGSTHIYFPTGHAIAYRFLPHYLFQQPLNTLIDTQENRTAHWLFRRAILTPKEAHLKNLFCTYLNLNILPNFIDDSFQRSIKRLEDALHITRTYAPSAPIVPYQIRLNVQDPFKTATRPQDTFRPLSVYREMTILRLPRFKATYKTIKFDLQDFYYQHINSQTRVTNAPYQTRKQHLTTIKKERVKLLQYLLPRHRIGSPDLIKRFALNTLKQTELPSHTQPNHTLLQLSTRH